MHHEKKKPNEIFVGNTHTINGHLDPKFNGLKTARLGNIAYDIHGKIISKEHYPDLKPMFICKSESSLYDIIMID